MYECKIGPKFACEFYCDGCVSHFKICNVCIGLAV